MEYDDYSYAEYRYDDASYGHDDYESDMSHIDYGENETNIYYDTYGQEISYEAFDGLPTQDDHSMVEKSYDWDIDGPDDDI